VYAVGQVTTSDVAIPVDAQDLSSVIYRDEVELAGVAGDGSDWCAQYGCEVADTYAASRATAYVLPVLLDDPKKDKIDGDA
jgi:hypothetical protein